MFNLFSRFKRKPKPIVRVRVEVKANGYCTYHPEYYDKKFKRYWGIHDYGCEIIGTTILDKGDKFNTFTDANELCLKWLAYAEKQEAIEWANKQVDSFYRDCKIPEPIKYLNSDRTT